MARGRTPGFQMGEEHRLKIKNSNILNVLIQHVEGKRDMSSTQVTAGLGLLAKVMPNLSENKSTVQHLVARELSDNELADIAVGSSEGTAEPPVDPSQLN
jgi:uncharacterized protein YjiS (DUF1127 family)